MKTSTTGKNAFWHRVLNQCRWFNKVDRSNSSISYHHIVAENGIAIKLVTVYGLCLHSGESTHPKKKQKSEEVTSKPSDGPKLDSVRAPARGSKVEWHGIGRKRQIWELRILSEMPLQRCCLPRMVCFSLLWLSFSRRPCHSSTPTFKVRWGAGFPQSSSGWLARSASLPLLGGSSSSSLFFHSFYAKGFFII